MIMALWVSVVAHVALLNCLCPIQAKAWYAGHSGVWLFAGARCLMFSSTPAVCGLTRSSAVGIVVVVLLYINFHIGLRPFIQHPLYNTSSHSNTYSYLAS